MKKSLVDIYKNEKKRILEKCNECGLCIENCPIIDKTDLKDLSPKEIQKDCINFLKDGIKNDTVYTKAYCCMECFKCMENICPQGLKPMMINEIIKWDYIQNSHLQNEYNDPKNTKSFQRIIASIQTSRKDFKKISTSSDKTSAKYVFFPGCNVYFQPEKILNSIDIMNLITEDYAFVPGLDYCCGNVHLYSGEIEKGEKSINNLIDKISSYNPETVILWCSTCQCRFKETISLIRELPFKIISFPQFLAEHMDKLPIKKQIPEKSVTLHEPCKLAYTGLDLTGSRDVLNKMPGIKLKEMPRHGSNTACCGSGSIDYFPESFEKVRDERLLEAESTNADILVDVCHFCHEVFSQQENKYKISVINYVNLLAEAVGIHREDKYKKYKKWENINIIMEDAKKYIKQSPYSKEEIIEALKKII